MFKHIVITVLLGMLFAGHAQAVTYGDRDTMGEFARSIGGATLKPAPGDSQDGLAEVGVTRDVKEFSDLMISVVPWSEPNARDWLLILAGIGLVGLMVERNRRRLF